MVVIGRNFNMWKCFLKFLFEVSGGFACAITSQRERIYHIAKVGRLLKRYVRIFTSFYDDQFLILLLLNYYQILNFFGSLLSFEDIYLGFYLELNQVRQRWSIKRPMGRPFLIGLIILILRVQSNQSIRLFISTWTTIGLSSSKNPKKA